jgi:hypothetical protein
LVRVNEVTASAVNVDVAFAVVSPRAKLGSLKESVGGERYPLPIVALAPTAHRSTLLNDIAVTIPRLLTVATPTAVVPEGGAETVIVGAVAYPNPELAIDTDPGETAVLDILPLPPVGAVKVSIGSEAYPKPIVAAVPTAHGSATLNEIAVTRPDVLIVAIPTAVWIPTPERKVLPMLIVGADRYPLP